MKGLCGWFSGTERVDTAATLTAMLAASRTDVTGAATWVQPDAALAAYGDGARLRVFESDGFLLAIDGHPRLGGTGQSSTDLRDLAAALRREGKAALRHIGGDFALAAWDGQRQRGLLAIDRIGVRRLMYARVGQGLAFASTLDGLGGCPGVRRELSPQTLFDYVYFHVCPGPETVLQGLMRMPPGHCIEFGSGADGAMPVPYWSMHFEGQNRPSLEALEAEFLTLLEQAVKDAHGTEACGAFLSGGTDSSTVAGMLGRANGRPAQTFSIGFDVAGYDEMSYARIAATHFGCEHHEYYVTPQDVVDAVPKIAASYDQPFGNASAIPTYYCARLAREHGMTRLVAGDGGDELFGGNERYAKYHLLSLYHHLPAVARHGLIEPLLLSTPVTGKLPLVRKLRSYVEQARPPMPQRYQSYNLLLHLGIAEVFTPDFLASVRATHPQDLLIEAHAPFRGASQIDQMLGIDLRFTLADSDLPKVTHMCDLAGMDVAFPLLDERLVEFSGKLPAHYKLRGTKLRWFFKHALRSFLPPAVISKQKHGFGLPVGSWLVGHKPLNDLACESIALLRERGVVRPEFIDDLMQRRLQEHAPYYGTMAWVLMMLGLWLDSRRL